MEEGRVIPCQREAEKYEIEEEEEEEEEDLSVTASLSSVAS